MDPAIMYMSPPNKPTSLGLNHSNATPVNSMEKPMIVLETVAESPKYRPCHLAGIVSMATVSRRVLPMPLKMAVMQNNTAAKLKSAV